jgi:hypothetical protein
MMMIIIIIIIILIWRVQLLLCSGCEIGEYITTVSEQRLGKHVPAEKNTHVTICLLL